jgi:UPF0755 protein
VSARRRRGEDEFADERPWPAEEDDAAPWPPDADDGWADSPEPDSGGGRRGRHSGPPVEPGGWDATSRLPRQAGPHGRPGPGAAPGWDDPGQEDQYALRRDPEPPPARRAAPRGPDPRAADPYRGGTGGNRLPGGQYPGPAGQDFDPGATGRRAGRRGVAPTGNPPQPGGYQDPGDRYGGPGGAVADPLQRPSARGEDPAGRYPGGAGRRSRSAGPAGYSDPGDQYAGRDDRYGDSGGRYGGQDDQYRDQGGPYGGRDDRYADPGGRYGGQDDQYRDQGGRYGGRDDRYGDPSGRDDQYGDPRGQYRDPQGRDREATGRNGVPGGGSGDQDGWPGDRGRGYSDPADRPEPPSGRRPGGREQYPEAGDGYPAADRGGAARYPGAGSRRAGPGDADYRDEYGEQPERDDPGWDDADNDQRDEGWPFGGGGGDSGDGGSRGRKRRKRRGRWAGPSSMLIVAAIILIPLIIGGIYAYKVISSHFDPPNYSGNGTGTVIFQVKPGDNSETVGVRLVTDGIVASSRALVLAAEHSSNTNELEPGYYRMHKHMNALLAWNLLLNPKARVQLTVTIPEGFRESQILAVLGQKSGIKASDYTKAIKDTKALGLPSYAKGNPEGYLYPDTYEIQPGMTATDVLKAMVTAFNQEAASINLPKAAKQGNLTEAQAIVVASLAQAEGGKDSDFPKITRVIYNRLRDHMQLDLDSTVMYALHTYGILASDKQLSVKSPYNTYAHTGLPPGPIDSPGAAAIQAALHPAKGNWLYFVTVNPKTKQTDFTSSPAVFQQYKNQLQQYLSSHGGG